VRSSLAPQCRDVSFSEELENLDIEIGAEHSRNRRPGEEECIESPTMTVYSPKGKNTGAAVVVFPGGGYYVLAIDLEGTEVCDWLTSKGITCVLLK
jgi:acetyl esterase/lipase